jgi:hypothetical protein
MLEKIKEPSNDEIELATQQETYGQTGSSDLAEEVGSNQINNQALGRVVEEALKELEHLSAYLMPLESPIAMFTSAISSPEGIKNEVSNITFEPWKVLRTYEVRNRESLSNASDGS